MLVAQLKAKESGGHSAATQQASRSGEYLAPEALFSRAICLDVSPYDAFKAISSSSCNVLFNTPNIFFAWPHKMGFPFIGQKTREGLIFVFSMMMHDDDGASHEMYP